MQSAAPENPSDLTSLLDIKKGTGYLQGCRNCSAGYFCIGGLPKITLQSNDTDAFPCAPGKFNRHMGQNSFAACEPCPVGQQCSENASEGLPCNAGEYASEGLPKCQPCGPGSYSNATAEECQQCWSGYKCAKSTSFETMTSADNACGPGKFSAPGFASCSAWPAK